MAELETFDPEPALADVNRALERDGAVIVKEMISAAGVDQIVEDLAPARAGTEPGSKSGAELWERFHGRSTIRFCGLAARSRAFVDHALLNPVLMGVADHWLLPWASDYWLNTGQVMAVGPGEPAQYVHRDQNNWPEALSAEKELTVSCMFALSEFSRENGATVVVPGSHRLPADEVLRGADLDPDEIAHAEMERGSGMIYSGKVVHGAGHNTSDGWRYGMHVSFVLGWLRPEEASPLVIDRARASELPERARELLGWGSYESMGGGRTWLVDFEDASRLFS